MQNTRVSLLITDKERNLLEEAAAFEPWLCDLLVEDGELGCQLYLSAEELTECMAAIVCAAACASSNREKEEFMSLADKISCTWRLKNYRAQNKRIVSNHYLI